MLALIKDVLKEYKENFTNIIIFSSIIYILYTLTVAIPLQIDTIYFVISFLLFIPIVNLLIFKFYQNPKEGIKNSFKILTKDNVLKYLVISWIKTFIFYLIFSLLFLFFLIHYQINDTYELGAGILLLLFITSIVFMIFFLFVDARFIETSSILKSFEIITKKEYWKTSIVYLLFLIVVIFPSSPIIYLLIKFLYKYNPFMSVFFGINAINSFLILPALMIGYWKLYQKGEKS